MPSREHTAFLLCDQASYCAAMGSPLYAHLLERAAADAESDGAVQALLEQFDAPNLRADALALRLMAAVHRLALTGHAPGLAPHYPTAGGSAGPDGVWDAFRDVVAEQADRLRPLIALPCQTNEVGRCAALAFGLLELAAVHGLPLRLLEVGASAGLNLRFDRFRYGGGGASWGPAKPPSISPAFGSKPLLTCQMSWRSSSEAAATHAPWTRRRPKAGCSSSRRSGRIRSRGCSACAPHLGWPPGSPRASSVRPSTSGYPASLESHDPGQRPSSTTPSSTGTCLEAGAAHLSPDLARAGAAPTREAPLAWLRFEATPATRGYAATLTTWPGGEERVVATAGARTDVRRPGSSA